MTQLIVGLENMETHGTLVISFGMSINMSCIVVTSEEFLLAHVALERAFLKVYVANVSTQMAVFSVGLAAFLARESGDAPAVGLSHVPTARNDCWEHFSAEWAAGR